MLAISQAICHYRRQAGIDGPLFIGCDTHALSQPAFESALEVLAANGVEVMDLGGRRIHADAGALAGDPRPQQRAAADGLADGIVITPSHNPPEDGGFKYNPTHGGPADSNVTGWIEKAGQSPAGRRPEGREAPALCAGPAGRDATCRVRFPRGLHRRSRQRARFRRHPRLRHSPRRRSAGRRRRALLGAHRRALPHRPHRGQRAGRSDLPLHDARLGRPHPHGSVLALRHAPADRPEGQIRHRLRLRHRPRSPRHRRARAG